MQGSNNMQYSHLALMNGVTQNTRLQASGASWNDSAQRVLLEGGSGEYKVEVVRSTVTLVISTVKIGHGRTDHVHKKHGYQ